MQEIEAHQLTLYEIIYVNDGSIDRSLWTFSRP